MADYTNSKPFMGALHVPGTISTQRPDLEPLLTPEKLKSLYLWGIQLFSGMKDPDTGIALEMDEEQLRDRIDNAITTAEAETKLVIAPHQIQERLPFDYNEYKSWGYMRVSQRPLASVEKLAVVPSNGMQIFDAPIEWIDQGQYKHGQVNLVPLTYALQGGQTSSAFYSTYNGVNSLMAIVGAGHSWIPSYWEITYTIGFPDGKIPKMVNQLIGVIAAMDVLSSVATTKANAQSSSLSIDNMSQSISGPGQDIYRTRMGDLKEQRELLIAKVRSAFKSKYNFDNI